MFYQEAASLIVAASYLNKNKDYFNLPEEKDRLA